MKQLILVLFVLQLSCKKPDSFNAVTMYIPHSFYPGSSASTANLEFHPVANHPGEITYYELTIYDSENDIVFSTTNYPTGWNGLKRNTGEAEPSGYYAFVLKWRDLSHTEATQSGSLFLLR